MKNEQEITIDAFLSGKGLTRQEAHNFRSYVAKRHLAVGKRGRKGLYPLAVLRSVFTAWSNRRIHAVYATPYHGADIIGIGSVIIAAATFIIVASYIVAHL